MQPRVAYFVHNLSDPAVLRRVRMLHAGGAHVVVLGFHRGSTVPEQLDGAPTVSLGQTGDARFLQRIASVLRHLAADKTVRRTASEATVLLARNLEMLVLAAKLKHGRQLVYECLDIHRLLLQDGVFARLIQRIERRLIKRVNLVLTSSPRFKDDYFSKRRGLSTKVLLLENKVLALGDTARRDAKPKPPVAPDEPIVIGWFGMLRCRRTFDMLADLVTRSEGRLEVRVAGIPSDAEFPDFERAVADIPGMTYLGPYRAEDLPELYSQIHFIWAIDYFEEGLNSVWLLPNRLYEALENDTVPIALREVETGCWLLRHGVGHVIDDPAAELPDFLEHLTNEHYAALITSIRQLPRSILQTTRSECIELVDELVGAAQK